MQLYKPIVCEGWNLPSLHYTLYIQHTNIHTSAHTHRLIGFETQIYIPLSMFSQGNTYQNEFTFAFYSLHSAYCVFLKRVPSIIPQMIVSSHSSPLLVYENSKQKCSNHLTSFNVDLIAPVCFPSSFSFSLPSNSSFIY